MNDSLQTLRAEARRLAHGKVPQGIRYPARFRVAAVTLARAQLRRGQRVDRIAEGLGVTTPTVARWLQRPHAPVLRPVAVIAPPAAAAPGSRIVLVTPHGVRVEGLDREGLVAVLRALG
jgi:hypothetical protein